MRSALTGHGIIVGDELEATAHEISPAWVRSYLESTGTLPDWRHPVENGAPAPVALLSLLWFRPAETTYEFSPDRVQMSQALTCHSPLRIGATVLVTGRVTDKYERRGRVIAVFETTFTEAGGALLATATSHLMVPAGESATQDGATNRQ
jgi:hypothetical protein